MRLFLGSKGNAEDRIMSTTNFSSGGSHTKSFQELQCSPSLVGGLQQQLSIFFVAVDISSPLRHLLGILSSSLPFPKNLPYIRRPNSCIVVWQPLICWLGLFPSLYMLSIGCPCFKKTGSFVATHLKQPKPQAMYCL